MNYRLGLLITYVIYLFTVLGMLYAFLAPKVAHAWFFKEVEAKQITVEVIVEKTIETEIDRLSNKYGVASSTVRAVAKCESSMYGTAINHNRDANGEIWSSDFGPLQVNDYFHKERMEKLGLNIYDQYDSLEYGIMMMAEQGLSPWSASAGCWTSKI